MASEAAKNIYIYIYIYFFEVRSRVVLGIDAAEVSTVK
jgi:hypothetical protein